MPIHPRRPYLPTFDIYSPAANICNEHARIDKFEVHFPDHKFQVADEGALNLYLDRLFARCGLFSASYYRAGETTNRQNALRFAKDRLIGGPNIKLHRQRGIPDGVRNMAMRLALNFSRFYQSNSIARLASNSRRNPRVTLPANLALNGLFLENQWNLSVETLGENNNLLSGERWHDTRDVSRLFEQYVFLCMDHIERQLPCSPGHTHASILNRLAGRPNEYFTIEEMEQLQATPILRWSNPKLSACEIYFDQRTNNALAVIRRLLPRVMALAFSARADFHGMSMGRENNMPSISVDLNKKKTLRLKIYAKATDRIRIEVQYRESVRTLIRSLPHNSTLTQTIDHVIDHATRNAHKFLKQITLHKEDDVDYVGSLARFTSAISRVIGNDKTRLHNFLERLAIVGSFTLPSQTNSRELHPYQQLVDAGIMEIKKPKRRNTQRIYELTPEYQWILDFMSPFPNS